VRLYTDIAVPETSRDANGPTGIIVQGLLSGAGVMRFLVDAGFSVKLTNGGAVYPSVVEMAEFLLYGY
jgi:hypothetical protein